MIIKQLTVLTENSASHLSRIMSILSDEGINIRAHCLVDNGDGYGKLRMIVSDPDTTIRILRDRNVAAVENDVVMVETEDRPGGLSGILGMLATDDIQIEYSYTAASQKAGSAVMVFRFSDNRNAADMLARHGLKPLKPHLA